MAARRGARRGALRTVVLGGRGAADLARWQHAGELTKGHICATVCFP